MLTWFIRRRLDAFQRKFDYNLDYARDILDADLTAFLRFARLGGLSVYRRGVPLDVYYAVKLTGTLSEDCGPCTQLMVAMALQDGVAPRVVAGVLGSAQAASDAGLDDAVRLGVRFTRATLAHDPAADELRDDIVGRWGPRGLVSLAFAIAAARVYPTLKYALGHGTACQRIVVAGETITPSRPATVAEPAATA